MKKGATGMRGSRLSLTDFFDYKEDQLIVAEARLELHGLFWFHTYAQPRDKYTHISLPIIHNYPLLISFLGRTVESSYASVSGHITLNIQPGDIWESKGFYVYPAVAFKLLARTLTFSMGGTGYVGFKPRTRASVPDYASNQVFLPGSIFKTYIIARDKDSLPRQKVIRLGAKRLGTFKVKYKKKFYGRVARYTGQALTHPFNARDCSTERHSSILSHYAGSIALSGEPPQIIRAKDGDVVLAAPSFVGVKRG